MKYDTGKLEIKIDGTYWQNGVLTIDGQDAREIVAVCERQGLCRRGMEVYKQDNKTISKKGRKK